MRHVPRNTILAMTFVSILAGPLAAETLRLQTRRHIAASEEGAKPAVEYRTVQWEGAKTAVIVCDMWAKHWCAGATDRVQQMAPRMNAFLGEARNRGALIIHAPSGGVKFYEDHPARHRARRLHGPRIYPWELAKAVGSWISRRGVSGPSIRRTAGAIAALRASRRQTLWTGIRLPSWKSPPKMR